MSKQPCAGWKRPGFWITIRGIRRGCQRRRRLPAARLWWEGQESGATCQERARGIPGAAPPLPASPTRQEREPARRHRGSRRKDVLDAPSIPEQQDSGWQMGAIRVTAPTRYTRVWNKRRKQKQRARTEEPEEMQREVEEREYTDPTCTTPLLPEGMKERKIRHHTKRKKFLFPFVFSVCTVSRKITPPPVLSLSSIEKKNNLVFVLS